MRHLKVEEEPPAEPGRKEARLTASGRLQLQ